MLTGTGAEDFAFNQGFAQVGDWHYGAGPTDAEGTVGAVALDASGGLAAATSTGGRAGQARGRVGDTPIIGSGTYANAHCRGVGDRRRGGVHPRRLCPRRRDRGGSGGADR